MTDADRDYRFGWIDVADCARYISVEPRAVYKLIREHRLPFRRVGRLLRFRRADLDQWLDDSVGGSAALRLVRGATK